jgi:hypothetical protein
MTGITYNTYLNSLANLAPVTASDPNFTADLPNIIDDAEFQCYTDLDLLNTVTTDSSATLSVNSRSFSLPSANGTFIVTQGFNVITPAGTTNPDLGTRNPLVPTTKEALNFLWPSVAGSTVPIYMAPVTQSSWIVGPWPDAAYTVEVSGTIRPAPLSSSNTTTLLSVYFPALFIAASMVRLSGYLKNYGAGVDDPKMAMTWSSRYQALLSSAEVEEARKKFSSAGWSDKQPAPLATPARV